MTIENEIKKLTLAIEALTLVISGTKNSEPVILPDKELKFDGEETANANDFVDSPDEGAIETPPVKPKAKRKSKSSAKDKVNSSIDSKLNSVDLLPKAQATAREAVEGGIDRESIKKLVTKLGGSMLSELSDDNLIVFTEEVTKMLNLNVATDDSVF